ncbi:PfkB family carbohydrate kinase [Microbacterium marinilacus]|uniref:PfkB family carbohydrate kinase n=1 Tax=Microbacterium marinilacus TaxID=415209 RepID=A0ABP7BSS7_9MICO|nr:PfkB family carbohydrate kinase [Microbacterium marinilacus]MBY0689238.1 hypothetical protein [Microbacterium marinilacus]
MRLLGVGDNVVDRYRALGRMFPGGNAVNVAVFASRLGADAAYLGVVGDDEAGQTVLQSLRQESVGTGLVTVTEGPNAYADVDVVGTDRVFLGSSKGVSVFEPTDEQFAAMEAFDVVHAGYAGSFLPHVPEMARRTRVSFDFGSRFGLETAAPVLPHLYLAAFSSSHRSDRESTELAQAAVAGGATYALATRGENGAYLASERWLIHQEADRVQVVDTLGAGDAFIASVLVGLLAGRDRRSVLAAASAHAAQVCLAHGAFGYGVPFQPSAEAGGAQKVNTEVNR